MARTTPATSQRRRWRTAESCKARSVMTWGWGQAVSGGWCLKKAAIVSKGQSPACYHLRFGLILQASLISKYPGPCEMPFEDCLGRWAFGGFAQTKIDLPSCIVSRASFFMRGPKRAKCLNMGVLREMRKQVLPPQKGLPCRGCPESASFFINSTLNPKS